MLKFELFRIKVSPFHDELEFVTFLLSIQQLTILHNFAPLSGNQTFTYLGQAHAFKVSAKIFPLSTLLGPD